MKYIEGNWYKFNWNGKDFAFIKFLREERDFIYYSEYVYKGKHYTIKSWASACNFIGPASLGEVSKSLQNKIMYYEIY